MLVAKRPIVVGLFRKRAHTGYWMRVQLLAQLECNFKIIALSYIRINVGTQLWLAYYIYSVYTSKGQQAGLCAVYSYVHNSGAR